MATAQHTETEELTGRVLRIIGAYGMGAPPGALTPHQETAGVTLRPGHVLVHGRCYGNDVPAVRAMQDAVAPPPT